MDAVQPSTVLAVPETAITYAAYGQTVFVATQDAAHGTRVSRVRVTTGERWQGRVEVTSGLAPGDRVVLEGNNQKQADFLSRSLAKVDPARLHDLHMIM
ncbi:malonate decarboxylase subunit alpha, partial [Pseudomonas sp. SIMBA_059]